jgi:iron(III) transport system permease protein
MATDSQAVGVLAPLPDLDEPEQNHQEPAAARKAVSGAGTRLAALTVLGILVFLVVIPMAYVIYGATRSGSPYDPESTASGDALRTVFTTSEYLWSFLGTTLLALTSAGLSVLMATVFAWLLARTNVPSKKFLEIAVILPLFLSPFVGAIAWVTLAAPRSGMLNVTARTLFGTSDPVIDITNTFGVVWVMAIYFVPYGYLLIAPSLKNMDPSMEEAAYLCGAGPLRTMRKVTLRLVRPAILSAFFLIAVIITGVFSIPAVLATRSDFVPLSVQLYRATAITPTNYALAAAIGCALLLLVSLCLYFYRRSVRQSKRFVTVTARGFRPRIVDLGRIRYVGAAVCILYAALAVVLPYAALTLVSLTPFTITDLRELVFTLDGFRDVLGSASVMQALGNTLLIGLIAPTLCVLLAMVLSYIVERTRTRLRQPLEYIAIAPVAIPGIVFGLGMLWAYIRTPFYGTIWILVAVFIASYLPHAIRGVSSGLLQIDRALEEAGSVCGASRATVFRKITMPLAKPAVLSAWIFVFILVIREINAAIVLYAPGSTVLSVLTWDYVQFGDFRAAAVVGLLQTALLLLGLVIGRFVFRVAVTSTRV